MSIGNLLNQFLGSAPATNNPSQLKQAASSLGSKIPGGLAGGAVAGGVMALLVGNKSARKFAGKAATYGGAAVLGGLAYQAYRNWQTHQGPATEAASPTAEAHNPHVAVLHSQQQYSATEQSFRSGAVLTNDFQLGLVKAMISAAKADGHIDANEQQRIFKAVEQMELSTELKGLVFELMTQPISVSEVAAEARGIEQKSELYLASCLAIDLNGTNEQAYLAQLAHALVLPEDLALQLQQQAAMAFQAAA